MPHTYTTYSIGNTAQNRPIPVHVFESTTKPLFRVLIDAGIHGIEVETTNGAKALIDDIRTANPTFYDNVTIAVIPEFNVDGIIDGLYDNFDGWQLQIDALIRITPETNAFFKFCNQFKPNVYVNGHNLDAWARGSGNYMWDRNVIYGPDTVLLRNDSISARKDTTWKQYDELITYLNNTFAPYKFDRFWSFTEAGEVNYYVPDIALYHHFIANRFNAVTFLIEAISSYQVWNEAEREARAIASSFRVFKGIIGYLKLHPQIVGTGADRLSSYPVGTEIPVRWDYIWEKKQFDTTNIVNDSNGAPSNQRLVSSSYRYLYEPTEFVTVPLGYIYPNTDDYLVLNHYLYNEQGNDFYGHIGSASEGYEVETIHMHSFTPGEIYENRSDFGWSKAPSDMITSNVDSTITDTSNYIIIECDQEGGNLIPYLLEPKSQYGYTRYPNLIEPLNIVQDSDYPIKRLIRRIA